MDEVKIPRIGSQIWEGDYSVKNDTDFRYGKRLKHFEYNYWAPWDEKIVVFSDLAIPNAADPKFASVPYKVAWMMEGPTLYSQWGQFIAIMKWLLDHLDLFTVVATCDDSLIARYPDKMKFCPIAGLMVRPEQTQIYPKTRLCSMTAGHMYPPRDAIYQAYNDTGLIEFLGKGVDKPYATVVDGFRDYMYHVSIPSSNAPRYFSSNLVDAFACGTVPIWNGCRRISDFFNMDGVILFDTVTDLDKILKMIGPDDYARRLPAIQENFRRVERFRTMDNNLWLNVLADIYARIQA
jgi:hypothetical protein